jgi:hypothetical protein
VAPKPPAPTHMAVCVIGLPLLVVTLHWFVFQASEIIPNVTPRPLGPCSVDWFSERPALVLACPQTDMIRSWSLPVEHPWFEDTGPVDSLARCCE